LTDIDRTSFLILLHTTDNTEKGDPPRVGSQQQLGVLSTMHHFLAAMHLHQQQQQQASGLSPSASTVGGDALTTGLSDDTPTTTVRAVLTEMTKALGGATMMGLLVQLKLPRTAAIFRLVSRLTSLPIPPADDHAAAALTNALNPADDGEKERVRRREEEESALRVSLSSLIDEITSAR